MYPRVIIDTKALEQNLSVVAEAVKGKGNCDTLALVTKGMCADPKLLDVICASSKVDFVADSRVKNIAGYADKVRAAGKKTLLLRIPMQSELADVAKYVDICMISEIETIKALAAEAEKLGKVQEIILMIDMGDLREGIFYQKKEEIYAAVETILAEKNISFKGIGVNLTCYGAIIPKNDNLSGLVAVAREIEEKYNIKLDIISGGNSSSYYLIDKGELPEGVNNLRLGESFLLGNETAYSARIEGTSAETIVLEAEIIELKTKPSLPIGEVGVDAFGQKPYYEDRGMMKRAIIAIGKQDTDLDSMEPMDSEIEIMGGSSDHIILDVTHASKEYKLGDIVSFRLGYGGMLKTMTSPYVEKTYK